MPLQNRLDWTAPEPNSKPAQPAKTNAIIDPAYQAYPAQAPAKPKRKQPAKYSRAWYLKQIEPYCEHYCADVKILELFALKHFLEHLQSRPTISMGGKVFDEDGTKPYQIQDSDLWQEPEDDN